jgi:hypothetical protein
LPTARGGYSGSAHRGILERLGLGPPRWQLGWKVTWRLGEA